MVASGMSDDCGWTDLANGKETDDDVAVSVRTRGPGTKTKSP